MSWVRIVRVDGYVRVPHRSQSGACWVGGVWWSAMG
jgi:hypothetical protein